MLGRLWGKKEEKKEKKEKKEIKRRKSGKARKEETEKTKAIKTTSGKLLQIIETRLKYKYNIKNLFEIMMDLRPPATKLHICAGFPPYFRYNGELLSSDLPALSDEETEALLLEFCPEDKIYELEENYFVEFCDEIPGLIRFKARLRKKDNGVNGVFSRVFPQTLSIDQLKLPTVYKDISRKESGLIIVTGPNSCGKTTTISALVKFISNTRHNKILVIDKPVEFIHPTKKSLIIHKEIGLDVSSYVDGIKQALTEDIDVLIIGDMGNREIISLALEACQRGILVLGEFYTTGTVKTLENIIRLFPESEKENICMKLSEHLEAIISQVIINVKEKMTERVVSEVFLPTPETSVLMRQGNFYQIPVIMERNSDYGMQTFEGEFERLVSQNKLSRDIAKEYCNNKRT